MNRTLAALILATVVAAPASAMSIVNRVHRAALGPAASWAERSAPDAPHGLVGWQIAHPHQLPFDWHAAAVAPVPEPDTWALLLAGGGICLGVARRRRAD